MSRTIVVVPCFNEALRLDVAQYRRFVARADDVLVLFVNDGSTDATGEVLARLVASDPRRFDVLELPHNGGKAEAVRRGLLWAIAHGAQYAAYWDADLSMPLEEIPRFCDVLDRRGAIDLVVGTRLDLLGRKIERSKLRRLLSRLFARVASRVLGLPIIDTQCGAKLLRLTRCTNAAVAQPFRTRWIFDVELLARMILWRQRHGLPPAAEAIYEMPLEQSLHVPGSKLRTADFARAAWELATVWRTYFGPTARPPLEAPPARFPVPPTAAARGSGNPALAAARRAA